MEEQGGVPSGGLPTHVTMPKPQTLITKYSQLAAQALCMQPEIGLKDLRLTGALHKHCVSSAAHETKRVSAESAALPSCTRV